MLYAWLYYENRIQDYYLPSGEKWSDRIAVWQSMSGWDRDYFIPIYALGGKSFISLPEQFRWDDGGERTGDLPVENGARYTMRSGNCTLGIVFTECTETDGIFKKFLLPPGDVSIGRGEDCALRIRPELRTVSKQQGFFSLRPDGVCTYTDNSKNGSHLNNIQLTSNATKLRFGDTITLGAGVKLIYLGGILAVDHLSAFTSIALTPVSPPEEKPRRDGLELPSVQIQFHRSPRFLQKPDVEPLHIDPPMEKQQQNNQPLWLTLGPSTTMVLPMLMGAAISSSRGGFMSAGLTMVGTASVLAVFWGLMNNNYRKKQADEIEKKRVGKYALYIREIDQRLRELNEREYRRLLETCPSVEECSRFPQTSRFRLWERMPKHTDFMSLRVGLGDVPLPNALETEDVKLSMVDDPLRDEPQRLVDAYGTIADAPVTVDLRRESVVGILGGEAAASLAQSILLQLAALHSYHDVRIAVLCEEGSYSRWDWTRWLPHVFSSEDRELRMIAVSPTAVQEVITHLDEVLSMRLESAMEKSGGKDDGGKADEELPLPHYVIFCTNPRILDNKPIMRHLLERPWGMTLVLLTPTMELLPKECHIVLDAGASPGAIYTSDGDARRMDFEYPNLELVKQFSHMLAPLRVKDSSESAAIPSMVSFLDLYNVREVEHLDVWRLWSRNHAYEGLRSTIGLGAGSQRFVLDISDKAHGPHGLVAGTTGSGKSVMLQTYILSLALNYHPDQIRFILVDYKGGGMADAFRRLPHVTGIIDNLQTGNTIARALASIQGEIHRRERIFRDADVNNIDDYIRFYYDDPAQERLPHLIIIVDEFAELKADQPDFMRELISASRVGRSLGVHLILSTQKPSNSFSDEIWANSNFKICLRVQSRSDSMEMLHRPDAAYLKARGRCYVQIGNDEIFEQVQTSYSGLTYNPNEPSETELPHLLTATGKVVSTKRQKSGGSNREVTQMDAVLERIIGTAKEHGLPESYRLWMEELSSRIFHGSLPDASTPERDLWIGPNDGENLGVVYAMGDDVHNQKHFPVSLDFIANRNYMVVGMATTGKTTFVQTVVMALALRYSPAALNMYILSLSSRTLGSLADLPHVGEIIYGEEEAELRRLIDLLEKEDARRRSLFAEIATDSFLAYNQFRNLKGESIVPAIVVFIDRFAQVMEMIGNDDLYTQKLYALLREGSGRGIFFVATAMKTNEIPYKVRDCFRGIGLQINDRADYTDIVGMRMPSDMPDIAQFPGRALAAVGDSLYEVQIALAGTHEADVERAAELNAVGKELAAKWDGPLPQHLPRIPSEPTWELFSATEEYQAAKDDPWRFPLAYDLDKGVPAVVSMENSFSFLITGARQSGKTNLLRLIAEQWCSRGAEVVVLGDVTWAPLCKRLGAKLYDVKSDEWAAYFNDFNAEVTRRNQLRKKVQAEDLKRFDETVRGFRPIVFLVDNLDAMMTACAEPVKKYFAFLVQDAAKYNIYFFGAISHLAFGQNRIQEPMLTLSRQGRGIALGGKLSECDPWNVPMPAMKKNKALPLGEAYLILNGEVSHIVIPKAPEDGE